RRAHFGEGEYARSEQTIRQLLAQNGALVPKRTTKVADATPTQIVTPESYLGYARLDSARYVGRAVRPNVVRAYTFPRRQPGNALSYAGDWKIGDQRALAVRGSRLRLHFHARNVYLVLGGHGTVQTLVDGKRAG